MLYTSEKTNKSYKTIKELEAAEAEFDKAQAEKEQLASIKRIRAKEVSAAYADIQKAQKKYLQLRDKFIEDYGSFHMTYTNDDNDNEEISSYSFEDIFRILFGLDDKNTTK